MMLGLAGRLANLLPVSLLLLRSSVASENINVDPRGSYGHFANLDDVKPLGKRGLFDLSQVSGGDATIIQVCRLIPLSSAKLTSSQQAWVDLSNVVDVVVQNPNPNVLQNYFDPGDAGDVANVFQTIQGMIAPGGVQNPPNAGLGPTDLQEIQVLRTNAGCGNLVLAFSEAVGTSTNVRNPRKITICDFGWNVLYRRLRRDLTCEMIGPKVNYKMQFLGPLLLHEVLHFNNVGNMAWNNVLGPNAVIDDMPGNFPCFSKAYGPYEAMQLRQRDSAMAKRNNENYVWYALVSQDGLFPIPMR
ncbi:MAG: hypothetical protein Q9174_004926 [Haloplaca sp. 1 TL-2023]